MASSPRRVPAAAAGARRLVAAGGLAAALLATACGSSSSPSSTSSSPTATAPASSVSSQSGGGSARVVIAPTHGGVGTAIRVTGTGYPPGAALSGTLCAVDAHGVVVSPLSDCDVLDVVTVNADATGSFTTTYTVKRIPPARAGYQIGFGRPDDPTQSAGAAFTVDG